MGSLSMKRDLLISIRPPFVESIFAGTKTVELRRKIPAIEAGVRLWIYSTRPVAAIVGSADVSEVRRGSPAEIWRQYHELAGVEFTKFQSYYHEAAVAYGISLENVRIGRPIGLDVLRKVRPKFHPPQIMMSISSADAETLERFVFGE